MSLWFFSTAIFPVSDMAYVNRQENTYLVNISVLIKENATLWSSLKTRPGRTHQIKCLTTIQTAGGPNSKQPRKLRGGWGWEKIQGKGREENMVGNGDTSAGQISMSLFKNFTKAAGNLCRLLRRESTWQFCPKARFEQDSSSENQGHFNREKQSLKCTKYNHETTHPPQLTEQV